MIMENFERYKYIDNLSKGNKLLRLVWSLIWIFFFRPTPRRFLNNWRIFLLRVFGAKIGEGCRVLPSCRIWAPWNLKMGNYSVLADNVDCYSMNEIIIGSQVTVSQRSFLCTGSHDVSSLRMPLITRKIVIDDYAWVAAECFVGPGCHIQEGVVIGARSVVVKSCEPWGIYVGNPAKFKSKRVVIEKE